MRTLHARITFKNSVVVEIDKDGNWSDPALASIIPPGQQSGAEPDSVGRQVDRLVERFSVHILHIERRTTHSDGEARIY